MIWIKRAWRVFVGLTSILGVLLIAAVIGGVLLADRFLPSDPELPARGVLALNLDAGFPERPERFRFPSEPELTIHDAVAAIEAAAEDARIVALFADLNAAQIDFARAQALRRAIQRFNAAGKPSVVYSDSLGRDGTGMLETYLASAFTHVWMLPTGDVLFNGLGLEQPFFAEAFAEWGVVADFEQREAQKGMADMFTRRAFSPEVEANLRALLGAWTDQILDAVADARGLDAVALASVMDQGLIPAAQARRAGLVDALYYDDEMSEALDGLSGDAEWIDIAAYEASGVPAPPRDAPLVALITGAGAIFPDALETGPFDGPEGFRPFAVADALADALEDPAVDAVILRVDSPGGDYIASDIVHRAVTRFRGSGKPIVASFGDYAASGGYFAGMAADAIVAEEGSLVGSIGVITGKFSAQALLADIGVGIDRVETGANALMFSPARRFSPDQAALLAAQADRIYADFRAKAMAARGLDEAAMARADGGRVFTGRQALDVGLVDALGGIGAAQDIVRRRLDLPADAPLNLVPLPEAPPIWESLLAYADGGAPLPLSLGHEPAWRAALDRLGLPAGLDPRLFSGHPMTAMPPSRLVH